MQNMQVWKAHAELAMRGFRQSDRQIRDQLLLM
jgi:hypothetical protein